MSSDTIQWPSADAGRARVDFDWGWRFLKDDAPGAEAPGYEDSAWRALDLPHDWSIEGPFREDNPTTARGGYLPGGVGWYRKTFALPKAYKGRKVVIEFEGVHMNSDVWINGRHLGRWPYGYTSFEYDLTPRLHFGGKPNVLAVRVDNSAQPASRWYTGCGIYRHVWLRSTDKLRVGQWGTYITTPVVGADAAVLQVRTTIASAYREAKRFTLVTAIAGKEDGAVVAEAQSEHEVGANGEIMVHQRLNVTAPRLWSCEAPNLYEARTRVLLDGAQVDNVETTFGIRDLQFHPDRGFLLNGAPVKMKGVCLHHDLGCLGAACFDRAVERQVELMIAMGANAIRTSHNPPAPHLLDYCDRRGVLVMDEAFDEWTIGKNPAVFKNGVRMARMPIHAYAQYFADWAERDLRAMVRRDRNHPCVVLWSIGNEIHDVALPFGADVARKLAAIVHEEDRTRAVTAACNNSKGANESGAMLALDVAGYNYKERFYAEDHARWPARSIVGTETRSAVPYAPRGVYDLAALATDARVKEADFSMRTSMDNDYVEGLFIWTGMDYIGEPTPQSWPSRSSYFGPVDLCGLPKDGYYYYQANWGDKPVLHVFPHWNWPGREGLEIPVFCHSNCDSVELFLNGRSLGARVKKPDGITPGYETPWKAPYEPGTLKAVGMIGDRVVRETHMRTAGAPARIVLQADRATIAADARDLVFVTAKIVDKDGLVVPTANNAVTFRVEGAARLLAVDNGDPTDVTGFQKDHIDALSGLCVAVAQSTRDAGAITITASAAGLEAGNVTLKAVG